jgi:transposase
MTPTAICPRCHQGSQRVHSYYLRTPHDLPISGQIVQLQLRVRRFRCQNRACVQKTFAERLPELVPVHAQRTPRLRTTLLGVARVMSAQASERLLILLGMPTSADTLLRLVKQEVLPPVVAPKVVGVDDFALRRGKTYGTIFVDLDTHRPIDLLPERTAQTLSSWLQRHPGVEILSRDRSSEYARGATEGAPHAQQVVDRWHVLKNIGDVMQRVVGRTQATLTQRYLAAGGTIRPRAKRQRGRGEALASQAALLRRQARYEEVLTYTHQGMGITAIAALLHMSPTTVRKWVYAGAFPERSTHRHHEGPLDRYLPFLQQQVQAGCTNAKELWRTIHDQGFPLGYNVVNAWLRSYLAQPGRRSSAREQARREAFTAVVPKDTQVPTTSGSIMLPPAQDSREPLGSPRHLAWLLLRKPTSLNRGEQEVLAFIRQEHAINEAYLLVQQFVAMVRNRQRDVFDAWLQACRRSGIPDRQTFAEGLQRDYSAVKAALLLPYSNGPVEGHINRLKFIKRSMYGRGSFHLLRQRVLPAA